MCAVVFNIHIITQTVFNVEWALISSDLRYRGGGTPTCGPGMAFRTTPAEFNH